jgi:hypothetical protein
MLGKHKLIFKGQIFSTKEQQYSVNMDLDNKSTTTPPPFVVIDYHLTKSYILANK